MTGGEKIGKRFDITVEELCDYLLEHNILKKDFIHKFEKPVKKGEKKPEKK